jgi:hypothetical protein
VTEGAIAGAEALLALNPIQRAKQKSKEPEHDKENVILNGLQTARQEQYLCLEISVSLFFAVFRGTGGRFYSAFKAEGEPTTKTILNDEGRQALTVVELAKKFLRNLSAILSDLYDYLFVQPDIHRG